MALMFLAETVRAYRERDPAARSNLEVFLCYPGLHAVAIHAVSGYFWRRRMYYAGPVHLTYRAVPDRELKFTLARNWGGG